MRVAVVGNGPSAIGCGAEIDACDFVVRCRSFWDRTKDVGEKTNAVGWFGSWEDDPFRPIDGEHWFTHCAKQVGWLPCGGDGVERLGRFFDASVGKDRRMLSDASWEKAVKFLGSHPSTGFIVVQMAMELLKPDELHLFGYDGSFGTFGHGAGDPIPLDQQNSHDMVSEKMALMDMLDGTFLGEQIQCKVKWHNPPDVVAKRKEYMPFPPAFPDLRGNVAFIHVKGTSERVPGKAMRKLGDVPLFARMIDTCRKCQMIDAVVIDSDSEEIRKIGVEHGAMPLVRPDDLATNATAGDGLETWAARNAPKSRMIVVPIPTSPFLSAASIDGAIRLLAHNPLKQSVAGVRRDKLFRWEVVDGVERPAYGDARTGQAMQETIWETTGLYVVKTQYALFYQQRINYDDCMAYTLSPLEGIDINTEDDMKLAEIIWKGLHS